MKSNFLNKSIGLDFLKRKKQIKKELQILIIKSIIRNRNISYWQRTAGNFFFIKNLKKKSTITKQQNVCLLTGKKKTTFKITNFSRQLTKKFSDLGLLQNITRFN